MSLLVTFCCDGSCLLFMYRFRPDVQQQMNGGGAAGGQQIPMQPQSHNQGWQGQSASTGQAQQEIPQYK